MSTTTHLCADIKGLLKNYKNKSLDGLLTDEDGNYLSDAKARVKLHNLIIDGHKYLPSDKCDNFDPFEHGCLGHETK